MKTLIIKDIINSNSANIDSKGTLVFEEIKKNLMREEKVQLDFTGINTLITAFLDYAIEPLHYLEFPENISNYVKIKRSSLSDSYFYKINLVLENSMEKREKLAQIQEDIMKDSYLDQF